MSHSRTSASTISPDRARVSTLGGIWTSRHKQSTPTYTPVEAARLRMDRLQVESSEPDRGSPRYLAVILLAGGVVDYLLFRVAVHVWHHFVTGIGGR
jgi:hypothetical protein